MCAVQTGERITSVDTLQDIDELYVTEVRLWLPSLACLITRNCCTGVFTCLLICMQVHCNSIAAMQATPRQPAASISTTQQRVASGIHTLTISSCQPPAPEITAYRKTALISPWHAPLFGMPGSCGHLVPDHTCRIAILALSYYVRQLYLPSALELCLKQLAITTGCVQAKLHQLQPQPQPRLKYRPWMHHLSNPCCETRCCSLSFHSKCTITCQRLRLSPRQLAWHAETPSSAYSAVSGSDDDGSQLREAAAFQALQEHSPATPSVKGHICANDVGCMQSITRQQGKSPRASEEPEVLRVDHDKYARRTGFFQRLAQRLLPRSMFSQPLPMTRQ